jgi:hypothetical protein
MLERQSKYSQVNYQQFSRNLQELLEALPDFDRCDLLELRKYLQHRLGQLDIEFKAVTCRHRQGVDDDPVKVKSLRVSASKLKTAKQLVNEQLRIYDELHPNEALEFSVKFQQAAMQNLTVQTYALIASQCSNCKPVLRPAPKPQPKA